MRAAAVLSLTLLLTGSVDADNAQDIATNTANIFKNTNDITTNKSDIQGNKNNIQSNKDTIVHNAGGVVNGTVIQSNKDLTAGVYRNQQTLQNLSRTARTSKRKVTENSRKIGNEHAWNKRQQNQISDLYGKSTQLKAKTTHIQNKVDHLKRDIVDLGDFTADVAAGSMAVSAIDFGTVAKGHYSLGVGVGYAKGDHQNDYSSWAGAVGIKYGVGEVSKDVYMSLDAKGWISGNSNAAAGAGAVFDF